jgi:calcium/calmodulin-dependent protein kinase I
LHRDLKPENLILRSKTDDYDVCIADFGLADYYDPTGNYMFKRCGTPGYVAPEVLADKIYDYKADAFSAGVIMFIL